MLGKNERKNYINYALHSAEKEANILSILDTLSEEHIEEELKKVSAFYSLEYVLEEIRIYYQYNGHTPIKERLTINGQTFPFYE